MGSKLYKNISSTCKLFFTTVSLQKKEERDVIWWGGGGKEMSGKREAKLWWYGADSVLTINITNWHIFYWGYSPAFC